MDLVDEQDDVARGLHLADQPLHAAFELAAELRARHKAGEVQQIYLPVLQARGHLARGDAQRNALGNGRFAHARLADEAGVVLLAAREYLDGAVYLPVAPDNCVQPAVACLLCEVLAVIIQKFAFFALFLRARVFLFAVLFFAGGKYPQREGARAARHKALFPAAVAVRALILFVLAGILAVGGAHAHHVLHHFRGVHVAALHHAGKAVLHGLQIFAGDAELLHDIVQRLNARACARAGKAVAFIFHFAVLHALHEHDGRAFLTFVTKHSSGFLSGPK